MQLGTILLGVLSCLVFCAIQTEAIKCGQTNCNEDKGGYCCAEKSSSTTKDCCCTGAVPNYSITCYHSSGLPIWAIVVIVLVVIGIIAGCVVGAIFIRRRRQNSVPYGQTS